MLLSRSSYANPTLLVLFELIPRPDFVHDVSIYTILCVCNRIHLESSNTFARLCLSLFLFWLAKRV